MHPLVLDERRRGCWWKGIKLFVIRLVILAGHPKRFTSLTETHTARHIGRHRYTQIRTLLSRNSLRSLSADSIMRGNLGCISLYTYAWVWCGINDVLCVGWFRPFVVGGLGYYGTERSRISCGISGDPARLHAGTQRVRRRRRRRAVMASFIGGVRRRKM